MLNNLEIAAALATDTDTLRAEARAYNDLWSAFADMPADSAAEVAAVPAMLKAAASLGSAAVKLADAAEAARKVKGRDSGRVMLAASLATDAATDAVKATAGMVKWFGADHAKGSYQTGLLSGWESWSGSSLKGKAGSFGASYAKSRDTLQSRISVAATEAAGVRFDTAKIGGRRVAVFVLPAAPVAG